MSEFDAFERRFAAAYRQYLDEAPTEIDALGVTRAAAQQRVARSAIWPISVPSRLALLLLLGALLAALLGGALLAGSSRPPTGWQLLDVPAGGTFADIAEGPGGYVAVGRDANGHAAFWSSSDCRRWEPAAARGTSVDALRAVTAGGPGYVALADGGVVAWTSTDGRSWRQVGDDPFRLSGAAIDASSYVKDLGVRAGRLVAVGAAESVSAIWTSGDGSSWTRVAPLEGAEQGYFYGLDDVIASEVGLVAVGEADTGVPIWTSRDGVAWRRAHDVATAADATPPSAQAGAMQWPRIFFVTVDRAGVLTAFGTRRSGWEAWTSRDGITWLSRPIPDLGPIGSIIIASMISTADGFVAVGRVEDAAAASPAVSAQPAASGLAFPYRGVIWTSADGIAWTRRPSHTGGRSDFEHALTCGRDLLVSGTLAGPPPPGVLGWEEIPSVWLLPEGAAPGGLRYLSTVPARR